MRLQIIHIFLCIQVARTIMAAASNEIDKKCEFSVRELKGYLKKTWRKCNWQLIRVN